MSTSTNPLADAGSVFVGAKDNANERVLSANTGLVVRVAVCAAASAAMVDSRMAINVFECGRDIGFLFLAMVV